MSNRIQKDAESLREKLHGTTPEQAQAQQTSALIILKEPLEKFVREGPKIVSKIETASKRISDSTSFHLSEQSKDALRKAGEEGADLMAKAFMEKLRKEAESIARNDRRVSIPDLGFYIFMLSSSASRASRPMLQSSTSPPGKLAPSTLSAWSCPASPLPQSQLSLP